MFTALSIIAENHSTLLSCVLVAFILSGVLLGASILLTVSNPDGEKTSAYECGFEPFEDARDRFDVRFYVVAILFLVFDVEIAFLFPWIQSADLTGSYGYTVVMCFLLILTLGFIYEIAKGALNHQ